MMPLLLWLGLGGSALAVAGAYFYRRRSRVIEVPAVDEWLRVGRPVEVRSIATLLRSLVSLTAQLLLIALVALALHECLVARPHARKLAVILDAGATMQSSEGAQSRYELAKQHARRALERAPQGCRIYLIAAAHRPMLAGDGATDRATALAALDALRPLDVESDLAAAVRAAGTFIGDDPAAELVVASDFAAAAPSALRADWKLEAALSLHPVGADPPAAVAVTNLWCERAAGGSTVGATVTSRGAAGRAAPVRVISGGATVATGEVKLIDGAATFRAEVSLPPLTPFEIVVDAQDALPTDDRAFGVTPPARRGVCLVTRGSAVVERALRADPSVPLRVVAPEQYAPAAASAPAGEVLIVDGVDLPDVPANVPALFIAARDPRGRVQVGEATEVGPVTHWSEHAALADVEPDLIRVRRALAARAGSVTPTALVSATDVPLVLDVTPPPAAGGTASAPALFWLFRLDDTDLATRASFPVLLWNAVDHLSGEDRAAGARLARTGRALEVAGTPDARLADPAGAAVELRRVGERLAARDVVRQGVYQVDSAGEKQPIAVNLLSDRAVRPLPREDDAVVDNSAASAASGRLSKLRGRARWEWIAAMALVVAVAEWCLFHRGFLRIA